jgi:hypothetical protein
LYLLARSDCAFAHHFMTPQLRISRLSEASLLAATQVVAQLIEPWLAARQGQAALAGWAVVLPFSEFVEDGSLRRHPRGALPMRRARCGDGVSFEGSLDALLQPDGELSHRRVNRHLQAIVLREPGQGRRPRLD